MTDEKELAVVAERPIATVGGTVGALRFRMQVLAEAARDVLKKNVDYGIIPGTGNKPTLLKPGAEKLATLFNLHPDPTLVDKLEDWDKGLFYYRYRVALNAQDGTFVCAAEGSANSREKKYRWRNVPEFKATDEEKATAVRRETRTAKTGKPYTMLILENAEPFDLINTLQKMAQKRALVAAILSGTGASEFYTQDIEDLDYGVADAEYTEPEPERNPPPTPAPPPVQRKQPADRRPAPPDLMRLSLRTQAGWLKAKDGSWSRIADDRQQPPQDAAVQRASAVIEKALADPMLPNEDTTLERHSVYGWLWAGRESGKNLCQQELDAMLAAWASTDDGWKPNQYAAPELHAILATALEDAGQTAMEL